MKTRFRDRTEAGNLLAGRLANYAGQPDVVVLALPRGGLPVGLAVAQQLHAPLDILVVRKLGVPGNEELAMGAIASGGVQVLNSDVVWAFAVSQDAIGRVAARERRELSRREQTYRGGRQPCPVEGRTIILVDDGIATGATARAALAVLRHQHAGRIIVAAPTIAEEALETLRQEADDVVAVIVPRNFTAVGDWYEDFSQTTDEEVRALLESVAFSPHAS